MRFLVVAIILLIPFEVCGVQWTVELDGSGDFVSLWDAVEFSSSGDTLSLGPGRHDDVHLGGGPVNYYPTRGFIVEKDLVLLGDPDGLTIVGPSEYDPESGLQQGIMTDGAVSVFLKDIVFENLFSAINNFESGTFVVTNCGFNNCKSPVMFMGGNSYIYGCNFSSNVEDAKHVFSVSQIELEVSRCTFSGGGVEPGVWTQGIGIQGTEKVSVSGCSFIDLSGGFSTNFDPQVSVEGCTFVNNPVVCYASSGGARLSFSGCHFSDQDYVVWNDNHGLQLRMENCVFERTRLAPLAILDILDGSYVHGSSLEKGDYGVVMYYPHVFDDPSPVKRDPVLRDFDMRNNFWNTTDPDSIQAWIDDSQDDPDVYFRVLWDPYLDQPVGAEKKSLGGLKSLFR